MDFTNFFGFVFEHLPLILTILALAFGLMKVCGHRASAGGAQSHLTDTEIKKANELGRKASEDVERRFGKHFGEKKS